MTCDTSSVFHIELLDADIQAAFDQSKPWIFETDLGQWAFATEEEACREQRQYRVETGFDPMTGERKD